jgi:hypothetical protein
MEDGREKSGEIQGGGGDQADSRQPVVDSR